MSVVLVVDDNEDNLRVTQEILKTKGFTVHVANDGASALRAIEQERPDVVPVSYTHLTLPTILRV